jgi:hypothetical protein
MLWSELLCLGDRTKTDDNPTILRLGRKPLPLQIPGNNKGNRQSSHVGFRQVIKDINFF